MIYCALCDRQQYFESNSSFLQAMADMGDMEDIVDSEAMADTEDTVDMVATVRINTIKLSTI